MNNLIHAQEHAATRDQLHDRLLEWMNTSREDDGYLPRELDYDTGLTMTAATRPKK
jgi:hypothetical protein